MRVPVCVRACLCICVCVCVRAHSRASLPGIQHPLPGIQHPLCGIQHPLPGIQHPLPATLYDPLPGMQHPLNHCHITDTPGMKKRNKAKFNMSAHCVKCECHNIYYGVISPEATNNDHVVTLPFQKLRCLCVLCECHSRTLPLQKPQ